jgi:dTDP-4-amino-4,6-dideoxygalactose transaminase
MFPFLDLRAQFETIRDEIMEVVTSTMESQRFILGAEVTAFESEIAQYVGCRHAVACASGSDALVLALMALGVGPGDEVITTPFTFVATAGSIARVGAKPVFVDIDPGTFTMDPIELAKAVTPRTRAVIPVHLYGLAAAMEPILAVARRYKLAVIEDAAQAIGAEYMGARTGTIGIFGCFSFFPSKNLGGAGDGGMVTSNSSELADRVRLLRVHGSRRKYHSEIIGINSRLDALQAAILRVKLRHLDTWTAARRNNASSYRKLFTNTSLRNQVLLPTEPDGFRHVYNQFVVRALLRNELQQYLVDSGIPTEIYYPEPLHLQQAFSHLGYHSGDFPQTEAASSCTLALPIFPELAIDQRALVVNAIAQFYADK